LFPFIALAIDIMTILASSCDCERLFSEPGDILESKGRAIGAGLLAAIHLVRSWLRAGFKFLPDRLESEVSDGDIDREYDVCNRSDLAN
jgi:hypothetical protein